MENICRLLKTCVLVDLFLESGYFPGDELGDMAVSDVCRFEDFELDPDAYRLPHRQSRPP